MKLVRLTEDVHADLLLMKSIKQCKNLSDTIRFILHHAGYSEAFFDRMRELGVKE